MTILQNKLAKILAFCGMALALGYVASFIKIYSLPNGGSVTLISMFFICLIGYWYGLKVGLMAAVAYGLLQLIQKPMYIHPVQICLDYLLGFGALGLSGLFKDRKNGLILGYLVAVFGRFCFVFLAGLMWITYYSPELNIGAVITGSAAYNGSYIAIEAIITVVIISLPPVKKAMAKVKELATQ